MAPKLNYEIIGIRPGEKLHEKMCSNNEAHLTLSFKNYFLIKPSITFSDKSINYELSSDKEKGKLVNKNFEYCSNTNPHFLTVKEIQELNKTLGF